MEIGNKIANLRKKQELTQQELARKLFVTDKTISSWESGRTEPSLEMLMKLSEILDCSISYLLYGDVSSQDIETEIKIKLSKEEYQKLEKELEKRATFLKEMKQKDTYYQPTYRKFIHEGVIKEWLRIGERGNKKILNYKNWYDIYCDEYEVEIDDVKSLENIFKALNLEKVALVNKMRKTYFYLDKYEFALDDVSDLGYFVEIEIKQYDEDILLEYDKLLKVAKSFSLNLDHIDRRGYPYYFIQKESEK